MRLILLLFVLLSVASSVFAKDAVVSEVIEEKRWYVEFREPGLDEAIIRRAIALELREVEIPEDPRRSKKQRKEHALHIRIARAEGILSVGMWDRGEFVGRRRVSDSAQARVLARRVGLAVGQLARRLSVRRKRLLALLQREALIEEEKQVARRIEEALRAPALRAQLGSLFLPEGAWLIGPSLGIAFNQYFPLMFTTEVGWLAGALPVLAPGTIGQNAPMWSQFDFSLGADYMIHAGAKTRFSLGALGALSLVHLSGAAEVDEISGQRDTWTARIGLHAGTSRQVLEKVAVRIDLSGGSLLRRIPITYGSEDIRLGGGFVGLSLGVSLKNWNGEGEE